MTTQPWRRLAKGTDSGKLMEQIRDRVNDLVDTLAGTIGGQVRLRGFTGTVKDPLDRASAPAATTNNYALDVQGANGLHAIFPLAATTAQPTLSNSAGAVNDNGIIAGAGKAFRAMASGGTNYAQWSSDTNGGAVLGGVGSSAGVVSGIVSAAISTFISIGTNPATTGAVRLANALQVYARNAANSANFLLVGSDNTNAVVLGDTTATALKAFANLIWPIDATYDIGASGATRPRDLFLAGKIVVDGDATFTGAVYTSFTPSVAQGASPTMTVNRARYRIFGKMANVDISMTVASGTGTASNAIIVTIPSAIQAAASGQALGTMQVTDVSAGAFFEGMAVSASATTIACYTNAAAGLLGATGSAMTAPLASPDVIRLNLTYEIA